MQERPFTKNEKDAADRFVSFLSGKDYGQGIGLFRFDIYVEPEINIGLQRDSIYAGCAHLSAHIDYTSYVNGDDEYRRKLLLNAALVLCNYLTKRMVLPKDFDAKKLTEDFAAYLEMNTLLLPLTALENTIIKPFETTKFNFAITKTIEVNDNHIQYDLVKIQDHINNQLSGITFGDSVRQFDFGYEIYDFHGQLKPWKETACILRYGTKYKNLLVVKQFDYHELKDKPGDEQFRILKEKILEGINDTGDLKRKPKDFDKDRFLATVSKALTSYSNIIK